MTERAHRICVGAIVALEGRVLMVRHVVDGRYDFWVCPGGGVHGSESLEQAAGREVREETGLDVAIGGLAYIEEFASPDTRCVKFWFLARLTGGALDTSHPEATREHIVEAAWWAPAELVGKTAFPSVITSRYEADAAAGFPEAVRLPLRRMEFW